MFVEHQIEGSTPKITQDRWMAVGTSHDADGYAAGAEAAAAALTGTDAALIIVFCNLRHDLEAVLAGVNETTGGIALVGCSTAGEMTSAGMTDGSVVVTALGGPGFRATATKVTGLAGHQREAGAEAAACIEAHGTDDAPIFMVLMDGVVTKQEEVLRGIYQVLGAGVRMVGGCAGDSAGTGNTFVLFNDEVLTDAVVGVALSSTGGFGIGVEHGWDTVGEALMATQTVDSRVDELNDLPALDVYLDRLHAPAEAYHDADVFNRFAQTHPLALRRRTGHEMRFITGANFETRSLCCLADVPESGLVWLASGDKRSVLGAADAACSSAISGLGGEPAIGFLAFDCVARRGVLGDDDAQTEVANVAAHAGDAPMAGFYTHGEIARVRGSNGFHNQTMVILALS